MPSVENNYVLPTWVAPRCLRLLKSQLVIGQFGNSSFEKEFTGPRAIGDTVTIKTPQRWLVSDGFEFDPQPINRQSRQITIDQACHIGFEVDSFDEALRMERSKSEIEEQYLKPAMAQLAQEIDSRFANYIRLHTPNVVGALGTTPTAWATYAAANTRMTELAASTEKRGLIMTPQMHETLIANSLTQFNPQDDISEQYRKGFVGTAMAGFKCYTSMSLKQHTTGIWATVATGVTVSGSGQSGTSLLVAATTGDTFKEGDKITIADVYAVHPMTRESTGRLKQFVIRADATAAGSAATLTISAGNGGQGIVGPGSPYQNVSALPLTTAVLTLMPGTSMSNATAKTGRFGVAITDNAYALVGVKLMMPSKAEETNQYNDPDSGIGVAFIKAFDPISRKMIYRWDTLFGIGELYPESDAVLIASAS